ncbi:uncharacterized protein G2W53_003051 [Senna tora]|uniref:Uncharacterized protein n=1 Tax=Senna tora TaxID=362788 RepID=A0A834XAN6_9FABA|nr:uncharacterized protein G2W53_003051 [Senna tora]
MLILAPLLPLKLLPENLGALGVMEGFESLDLKKKLEMTNTEKKGHESFTLFRPTKVTIRVFDV